MMTLQEKFQAEVAKRKGYYGSQEEFEDDGLNIIKMMEDAAKSGSSLIKLMSAQRVNGEVKGYGFWIRRHRERLLEQGITVTETVPGEQDFGMYYITLSWGKGE